MRTFRKVLLLPVLAVASAALVLAVNPVAATSLPPASTETIKVTNDDPIANGTALTVTNWRETAGLTKGNPGGANGVIGCAIKK